MHWTLIFCGLAMLEAALILWLVALVLRVRDEASAFLSAYTDRQDRIQGLEMENAELRHALRGIKRLDTPKAAHGVKKAVAIAKEALS